jgi:hypothetical protein
MKGFLSASLAILLLATAVHGQNKPKESPWYPLQIGNAWTYKDSAGQRFTLKVARHETIDKVPAARVEMLGPDGKMMAFEYVAVTDSGVFRYSFGDLKPDKPVMILKLPPKKGDEWKVDTKVLKESLTATFKIAEKEVKVPAGTYKTMEASSDDFEAAGMKLSCTFYFAENVGLVKMELKVSGQTIALELEKFEPGKK